MSRDLRLSLLAFGGFIVGLLTGGIWHIAPPDTKAWERRVVAYQQDSLRTATVVLAYASAVTRLEGEKKRLENERRVAVAIADLAAEDKVSAKLRADALTAELAKKASAADSVPVLVDALAERTLQAESTEREVRNLRDGMAAQIAATGRLMAALDTSKAMSDSLKHRLAIADDILRDHIKTEGCRVLVFKCPSRTTTFVVGAALGMVGAAVVIR